MLKILRKHSKHWVIGLIIGAIVVVFIFWGMGSRRAAQSNELAEVYGEAIPMTTYYQYANMMEKKARFRRNLSEEDYKALREGAQNGLIRLVLLDKAAERMGLTVTDAEVQAAIIRDPAFQHDGAFDPRIYDYFIGRGRNREAEKVAYENWLRKQLLAAKAIETIASFAKVSQAELQNYFRLVKEAVDVDYVVVNPESFLAKANPNDAELKEYYQKHEPQFRVPEKIKVSYLVVRSQDFLKKVQVSADNIADYVSVHASELVRPQVIKVREIFLAIPAKASSEKRQEIKQKAEELVKQARQPSTDFAQLARTKSQDEAHKAQGGELGSVSRGKKSEAWDKVAFALAPGEIGLAQTANGFNIIKLEQIQKSEPLPEAEAKARAQEKIKEEKSREMARDEAKRLQAEATTTSFKEMAQKNKLTPQETPFITLTEPIPGLGVVRAFNKEAFSLKAKEVGLAEVTGGFAVLQDIDRKAVYVPKFEEVKDKVRQAVAQQDAQKMAEKQAGQLLTRLRQGEPLAKVAAQASLPLKDSGFFTRLQGFMQQPLAESLTSAAFLLTEKQPYPDKPIAWQEKYYLLAFKKRRLPTQEEFEKDRENLERRVLADKQQVILDAWFREEWRRAQVSKPRKS
jgi:peptidyl-prolyl cis-trans isomerase D